MAVPSMGVRRRGVVVSLIVIGSLELIGCEPTPGKTRESRVVSNEKFSVRVEVMDEGNLAHTFEPGCHVSIQSAPLGTDRWRQFKNAYFGRCEDIPKNQVRFVNADTAYVFMQWSYAVTRDAGRSWSSWDVAGHLSDRVFYNPNLIQDVAINGGGTGTMTLNPEGVKDKQAMTLVTQDFGAHWNVKQVNQK